MKKAIAVLLGLLMVMQFVFATTKYGSRIDDYEKEDTPLNARVLVDRGSENKEVVVCATANGIPKIVFGNGVSVGVTLVTATKIIANWFSYTPLSRHYFCVAERV